MPGPVGPGAAPRRAIASAGGGRGCRHLAAPSLAARSAALALSIFGPRNAAETARVLGPGGALIMATPGPAHLGEVRRPLGMIGIDRQKLRRIAGAYRDWAQSGLTIVNYQLSLDHADLAALVTMGPSARHISPESLATPSARCPARSR